MFALLRQVHQNRESCPSGENIEKKRVTKGLREKEGGENGHVCIVINFNYIPCLAKKLASKLKPNKNKTLQKDLM